ncbi:hypothetical protein SJI19_22060 [Acerihabitans sp. TG2]|uniref:hypothetical protein n=1 Tax=Acerihabitans sp. TG2 TaxID=3096008 RepID=UPI002B237599|nr:hypothetical protein [Acerihabitans sp. TG2]MEA9393190.1 hypothetical protein [Acerihabitans sp. TG2]
MNIFVELLSDRFELSTVDDEMICVDDNTVIFYSEQDELITLLCPTFPLPDEQGKLVDLLVLNTQSDITFCAVEGLVLAKFVLNADDAFDDLCDRFSFYVGEIFSARDAFGYA